MTQSLKRKLIEVSLPLEAINEQSAREKEPFTRNHPRSLHIWWARRPAVTARAVLFAQLVDDPSSHPDRFPTIEAQRIERERLHEVLERLCVWENTDDAELFAEARREIVESCDGSPPRILDPFAGGATIPVEAQRLGLKTCASDLNPVAVLINKALIEIPVAFTDREPIFPGLAETELAGWKGLEGVKADIRAYGRSVRDDVKSATNALYPEVMVPNGSSRVIAWIWARTVVCPNPACRITMPLVRSWWLGKRKGREAYIEPTIDSDPTEPSGLRVGFEVKHDPAAAPIKSEDGTVSRNGAICINCATNVDLAYVRQEACESRMGQTLMAVVAEGDRRRTYLSLDNEQIRAAASAEELLPRDRLPQGAIPERALGFRVRAYGMTEWADLFTDRQLHTLGAFSAAIRKVRARVLEHGLRSGVEAGRRLEDAGDGAEAYADAITTYLGLALSRYTDISNSIASWNQTNENVRALFARQAIPMAWDFAEANPFGQIGFLGPLESVIKALNVATDVPGVALQQAAQSADFAGSVISTDPPYYDNIGYSDLSDFFYVWLRQTLRGVHGRLLDTMLVPKVDELVANPFRHGGKAGAHTFFEAGFRDVFAAAQGVAPVEFPITVYYAFKQSELGPDGRVSSGWETLLQGMIESGWRIMSTWPMRSERATRAVSIGSNALASSVVLTLRTRAKDAPTIDRRGLIDALQKELPVALRELQQGRISPVDLPQATVGPGMAIFSRYAAVIESDGSSMTVRSALARINEILDQVLNEQEGEFDATTRFAIAWYRQHGYGTGKFGDANNIANARNTSVEAMARGGVLTSAAGKVTLLAPGALPENYDPALDEQISAWEVLHHMIAGLDRDGLGRAGELLAAAGARIDAPVDADSVKELAFLLFLLAEKNGWTKDALAFNTLATSWPEIVDAARDGATRQTEQGAFDFDEEN